MQFARTSRTTIFKGEFNTSGWRRAAVIPSSQEWCCAYAHHPRINGTGSCVFQYPAFSAGEGRNRNRDAGNFAVGADALILLRPRRFFALLNNRNEWRPNPEMKKLFGLPVIISLAIFCSCQKQQTEEERKTEIERQVQERLAAERQGHSG